MAKIETKEWSREEIQIFYDEAVNEWNEHKNNIVKNKEEELLDSYPEEIIGDSDEKRKRRRKAIKTIKKNRYRQYTFKMLIKHIGKGEKNSLKQIKIINENNEIVKECQDRKNIEIEIAKYNKKHFRQAYSSKPFKDKIYPQLKCDEIQDRILNKILRREECDD